MLKCVWKYTIVAKMFWIVFISEICKSSNKPTLLLFYDFPMKVLENMRNTEKCFYIFYP